MLAADPAIRRRSGPALLLAGVVAGAGFEAKPQVALVAVVALGVLAVVGPRWPLRSPWLAAAIGAALLLAAPYVGWQAAHGWPQLTMAGNIAGSAEGGRVGYYLAGLYPALLGLGAVPVAAWMSPVGRRRLRTGLLVGAIAVTAVISAVIALPVLPASKLQVSITMAANPDMGETVGWPAFIDAVSRAWHAVPAAQRDHTAIFTANYGDAGAVDLLGRARGLPRAYSGHNGFADWGRPGPTDTSALLIGFDGPRRRRAGVRRLPDVDARGQRRRPGQPGAGPAGDGVPPDGGLGGALAPADAPELKVGSLRTAEPGCPIRRRLRAWGP